jgi:hypothetical protein
MEKDNLYFFIKDILNFLRECRLKFTEFLLPKNYYVQQDADFNTRLNYFPELGADICFYNRHEKFQATRDGNRVVQARLLLDLVRTYDGGDYAEIGTFRGNFARLIYRYKAAEAAVYCFDTFEGFAAKDLQVEKNLNTVSSRPGDFSQTSLERVYEMIGAPAGATDLILRKGYFPETYCGLEQKKWRFVHLDVDLYEPSLNVLKIFWPSLVPGGVLLIHDYNGHYRGVSKAVNEFFAPLGISVVPIGDKVGSAVVIKSRDT